MTFYNDKRDERAAMILSRYSADVVEDIIRLCQRKGGSLMSNIYAQETNSQATLRPYAILSNTYVDEDSFSSILLALDMIIIAEIRKPNFSNDRYQAILENAFGLPRQLSEPIAKRIETFDVLGGANPEGRALLTKVSDRLKETARRVANYAAGLLQLPWEIDQNQKYDIDFLYEMKLLGDAAKEFNVRAKLMASQAAINSNLGLLQTGDIDGIGGEDAVATEVGDILGRASLRVLPASMFGNMLPTMQLGSAATQSQAAQVLDQAGIVASKGNVEQHAPKNPVIGKIMKGIGAANPAMALLAGLATGSTGQLLKTAISNMKNKGSMMGDIDNELLGDITNMLGDDAATGWLAGDIESVAAGIGDVLAEDVSTGDVALDRQIEDEVANQYGDIDQARFGPEIGGIFTRFRTNMAKRRAAGRRRRTLRKAGRQANRNADAQAFYDARSQMSNDMFLPESSFQQGFRDEGMVNMPLQEMSSDYMPGDYEQSDSGVLPEFFNV